MQGAAAWVTVNVWPEIVRVPLRALVVLFAATDQVTVPAPVPLAGVNVSQAVALLDGVQLQPVLAVTFKAPMPPEETTDALAGEIE
jgi:hypothetical protein